MADEQVGRIQTQLDRRSFHLDLKGGRGGEGRCSRIGGRDLDEIGSNR